MAEWEIVLEPEEVCEAVRAYVAGKYKLPADATMNAVNDWPYVEIKMGTYKPESQ